MRRINICEERGTGIDKVIHAVEFYQLPAPEFIVEESFMKIILYSHRKFKDVNKEDRIRACYQHCALKYVSRDFMTNKPLRERFKNRDKENPTDRKKKYFFVPIKEIKEKDWNLSISKYREIEYEEIKYEKPEVLKKKILELEEEIIKGLKELEL